MSSIAIKPLILTSALVLAACAEEPFTPIVDGPVSASYQRDLAECRALSQQAQITNRETTTGAVVGGLVGAVSADSGEGLEGAIIGALLGGAVGRAGEGDALETRRAQIVFNCLKSRGHHVVG